MIKDQKLFEIYCPLSVVSAGLYKKLENYWNRTENFEALAEYIRQQLKRRWDVN